MINGHFEKQVINGDIWVRLQDVITGIGFIAEKTLTAAESGNIPYQAIQAHGIAEVAEGLQRILDNLRRTYNLT